jgi:hypothetical protein
MEIGVGGALHFVDGGCYDNDGIEAVGKFLLAGQSGECIVEIGKAASLRVDHIGQLAAPFRFALVCRPRSCQPEKPPRDRSVLVNLLVSQYALFICVVS